MHQLHKCPAHLVLVQTTNALNLAQDLSGPHHSFPLHLLAILLRTSTHALRSSTLLRNSDVRVKHSREGVLTFLILNPDEHSSS
jgi:hypothetical protein